MTIATVRRMAADIFGVGESRVRFNPTRIKEAEKALTRYDVRNLIKAGVVSKMPAKGRRKNEKAGKQGHGSRKGAAKARRGDKDLWMAKVRAQRALLRRLLDEGVLEPSLKRKLYLRIKSGLFKSKRAFILYLKDGGMLDKEYELVTKPAPQEKAEKKEPVKAEEKPKEANKK